MAIAILTLAAALLGVANAAVVTYDFNLGWVTANPDGAFDRQTIGINGQWPLPQIRGNIGNNIIVNVQNNLGEMASIHFHGLFMNGTNYMDGPVGTTQCPIPPGASFTYNFTVNQPGTYWYHSHVKGQYPDGLRGPLIIHDPNSPFEGQYDEELVLTVSDWYHGQMADLMPIFLNKANPTGAEPIPDNALFNDTQNLKVPVQPGKTYLFRMINVGAFAAQYVWFEGHDISIVEVDGVYTQPASTDMIYIAPAQRYSFLLTTKNDTSQNFAFVASMDTDLFDKVPASLDWNVTGWLQYDASQPYPDPGTVDAFNPFDDVTLVPFDQEPIFPEPDNVIELNLQMQNLGDGANYAFFNNITYKQPIVPTLYTALSAGDLADDPTVYGTYTQPFVLEQGQVVQIVINNLDTGKHPLHLHGHNYQALYRANPNSGTLESSNTTESDFSAVPMRRDTMVIWPSSYMVIRFQANNPGIWLFHCHIEWHVAAGLLATIVEAPLELQKTVQIPKDHLDACAAAGVPTTGNAAGNTVNFLDLTGQPTPPPPLPAGFEAKGIVALVFSCITGILGVIVVAWYGMAKPGDDAPAGAKRRVAEALVIDNAAATTAPAQEVVETADLGGTRAAT